MDVNRGDDGTNGDEVTEKIYTLALEAISDDGIVEDAYVYALCQKIREIPSILIDKTFSVILNSDENPDDDTSKEKGNKKLINKSKEDDNRAALANAASHIKDTATLWLKASFHQILASVPDSDYRNVVNAVKGAAEKAKDIVGFLKPTGQFEALQPFYSDELISEFITNQLIPLQQLDYSKKKIKAVIEKKPAEQKTVSEDRAKIIGARPDTYIPSDEEIAEDQTLFLVETRKTASYLGLTSEDKYGYVPPKKKGVK